MPNKLSIGEVADVAGLATSALRYYERVGLLPKATRVNGRRVYEESVLRRLTAIRVAREAGFTISEAKALLGNVDEETPVSERWRTMAERKLADVEALIERAQGMKRLLEEGLACGCVSFDDCGIMRRASRGELAGSGDDTRRL